MWVFRDDGVALDHTPSDGILALEIECPGRFSLDFNFKLPQQTFGHSIAGSFVAIIYL